MRSQSVWNRNRDARLAEAVLRDEKAILPVSIPQAAFGGSLSLPSVIGTGVERVLIPQMSGEEAALHASAGHIAGASARLMQ